jgi:hypothetical protein
LNKKKENPNDNEIITSSLLSENTELKKRLREIEQEKREVSYQQSSKTINNTGLIRNENDQLQKEI